MPSFTPWMALDGNAQPGSPVQGGMGGPQPFFRSAMDAKLSQWNNQGPEDFPRGYLSTITSRRDDRLLDNLKTRGNQRAYSRGVHVGSRVDPGSYAWPKEFNPQTGIKLESEGLKFAPLGVATLGMGPNQLSVVDTDPGVGLRSRQMRRMAPEWR